MVCYRAQYFHLKYEGLGGGAHRCDLHQGAWCKDRIGDASMSTNLNVTYSETKPRLPPKKSLALIF